MADISMCRGEGCERRENCYRFTAPPSSYRQAYMRPDPKNCEHYWPVVSRSEMRRLDIMTAKEIKEGKSE